MTDTKYGDLITGDEWDEPEETTDPHRPRCETNTHTVVIDRLVDEEYVERYRWRFAVSGRIVRGWTRSDIEHNGTEDYTNDLTWETMPESVRVQLARELAIDDWDGHLDLPDHLAEGDNAE